MHRLATGRPHLDFAGVPDEDLMMMGMGASGNVDAAMSSSVASSAMSGSFRAKGHRIGGGWIKMHSPLDPSASQEEDDDADAKREPAFVIYEADENSTS